MGLGAGRLGQAESLHREGVKHRFCRCDEIASSSVAVHSELAAWLMPPVARTEWLTLMALLEELPDSEVPCRADPVAWWPEGKGVTTADTLAAVNAVGAAERGSPASTTP